MRMEGVSACVLTLCCHRLSRGLASRTTEARFEQKIASSSRSDEIASGAALFGMMKQPLPPDSSWQQARQGEQPLFLLGV